MEEIKDSILAGLAFGVLLGLFYMVFVDIHYALIAGSISGVVFGGALYLLVTSETFKMQTRIKIPKGENVIHSGRANYFLNNIAVGGKLYLLPSGIRFKSHGFFQNQKLTIINIEQIKEVSFYNTLRIVPTGLSITTFEGKIEKFVVGGRKLWKEEIGKLIENKNSTFAHFNNRNL